MSEIQGKVVRVLSPMELVINLGSSHGVTENSRFIIFTMGEEMKDPDTGDPLGQLEIVRGRAEAKHVQEKMTTIRSTETQKLLKDQRRQRRDPLGIFAGMGGPSAYETFTEVTWVDAPFQGVQVGDLVRVL